MTRNGGPQFGACLILSDLKFSSCPLKDTVRVLLGPRFPCGPYPITAGTFQETFRKNPGTTPKMLSELFLEFPSSVRLGSPKPYNSRHLKPPQYGWGRLFFHKWFRRGPLRAAHGIPSSIVHETVFKHLLTLP